jgi:hypothetical protein
VGFAGLVFAVSLLVRLSAIHIFAADADGLATAHHEHASIAKSLAQGQGFRFNFFGPLSDPVLTSVEAPLVPGLLAACYLIFGIESRAAFGAMLHIQAVASALTVLGLYRLTFHLTRNPTRARWVALLATLYPPLVMACLHIQALVWNLGWLTLLVLSASHWLVGNRARGAIGLAVGAIGGIHTDPILGAVFAGLAALSAISECKRPPQTSQSADRSLVVRLAPLAAGVVAVLVGITPWTIRNYQVHGRLVFIKSSFWYVLWQGNNAVSVGTDKLPVDISDSRLFARSLNPFAAHQAAFQTRERSTSVNVVLSDRFIAELQAIPDEISRMDRFRLLALHELCDHPLRYLSQCGRRFWFWLWFDPTNPRSYVPAYRIGYVALLLCAVLGVWQMRREAARFGPLLVTAAVLTVVHVLIITSARFRIPLEMLLLVPAGSLAGRLAVVIRWRWRRVARRASAARSAKPVFPIFPG